MKKGSFINIIHNKLPNSVAVAKEVALKLDALGYHTSEVYNDKASLNICIGGDGVFLRALKDYDFPDIPFIGINTGHLGFVQEICPDNIDEFIRRLSIGDYSVNNIHVIESTICTRTSCIELLGINEFVVKGIDSKTIHMNISINDIHLEKFSGDGVIVSSPFGSSAYNFSAGGALIDPSLSVLQLTPLAPISSKVYRSLTNSAIVPNGMKIKVNPEYRDENFIIISVDGFQHRYENITEIEFNTSKLCIKMLGFGKDVFWSKLKEKFL